MRSLLFPLILLTILFIQDSFACKDNFDRFPHRYIITYEGNLDIERFKRLIETESIQADVSEFGIITILSETPIFHNFYHRQLTKSLFPEIRAIEKEEISYALGALHPNPPSIHPEELNFTYEQRFFITLQDDADLSSFKEAISSYPGIKLDSKMSLDLLGIIPVLSGPLVMGNVDQLKNLRWRFPQIKAIEREDDVGL